MANRARPRPLALILVAALSTLAALGPLAPAAARGAAAAAAEFVPGELLVKPRPGRSVAAAAGRLGIASADGPVPEVRRVAVAPGSELATAARLRRDPDVEFAVPNYIRHIQLVPNDTRYAEQWALPKISAPAAWDITTGSTSIIIAVLDTGIDLNNPDFYGKLVAGRSTLEVQDPACPQPVDSFHDDQGHGSHVAAIAAAATNNGRHTAGVAWQSRIMPIKVATCTGAATDAALIAGLRHAAGNGASVINLSLGGLDPSPLVDAEITSAYQKGIAIVAAAGNEAGASAIPGGEVRPRYPGASPNVIAVAASDQNDQRATFSACGANVDLAAPGVAILSAHKDGFYAPVSGTSQATPHVAGAAALIRARFPAYTPAQVEQVLKASADKVGEHPYWGGTRNDYFGMGRLNVSRALQTAPTSVATAPIETSATSFRAVVPLVLRGGQLFCL